MRYELNNEIDVPLSASSIWQVYACKELPKLIVKLLHEVFDRIDYISGDGGVGTVIRIVFPPGEVPRSYKEMFGKIDHAQRLKEVQQISGGYLAMGVTSYVDKFKIISRGPNSCTIGSTMEYEMAKAIVEYVKEFGDYGQCMGNNLAHIAFLLKAIDDAPHYV
ncbi:hypothetical protein MKW92_009168 [Papaver armeniacum]|nr:hypothetical protein MKW92_009168 [Papaver armeniacum]